MGHKDPKTINLWLRDLREKGYVEWIYSTHFAEKTKPAVYYLGLNGIRFLKQLTTFNEDGEECATYSLPELRKRYRDGSRSQTYIERCTLLADCCLMLEQKSQGDKVYPYETEADYLQEESLYHFLADSELIYPQLCFEKREYDAGVGEDVTVNSYLLEVFDPTLPRYRMKKRLNDYVKFLDEESYEWEERMETDKLPIILFICPRTTDLIYAKRRTRKLISNAWEWKDEDEKRPRVRFATIDNLKRQGLFGEGVWEEA